MGSVKDLANDIGRTGHLRTAEGLVFAVIVNDARVSFGRVDVLVTPRDGSNAAWVNRDRVVFEKEAR